MAEFRIDRIRYNWKGDWVTGTVYIKDDIVSYGGKAFVALSSHTASVDFNTDLDYAVSGESTPKWEQQADGKQWKGIWLPSTFYKVNDLVKHRGIVYSCIDSHSSAASVALGLETDQAKWTPYAKGSNWLNVWSAFTEYKKNDVVRYNGIIYNCIADHQSNTLAAGLEFDQAKWEILLRSDLWKNNWAVGTRYIKDDVVRYGGNIYRCIIGHNSNNDTAEGIGTDLGLDSSAAKWELIAEGIEYKGQWTGSYHKTNDIVKYGSSLYKAKRGMSGTDVFDATNDWDLWVPGLGYETEWIPGIQYQPGDIVTYGGYTYTALETSIGVFPYENGLLQDAGEWEILARGYEMKGEWDITNTYPSGSVVTKRGYLYEARVLITSSDLVEPGDIATDPPNAAGETKWLLLSTGIYWKGEWREFLGYETVGDASDSTFLQYYQGDVVMDQSISYICKKQHYSNIFEARPIFDTDTETGANDYWNIYAGNSTSAANNTLRYRGDIRTYNTNADGSTVGPTNLTIGTTGQALRVNDTSTLTYEALNVTAKVYYVSVAGTDAVGFGTSIDTPYASINYACAYIRGDLAARAPATIFVTTGLYREVTPIVVPADTTIVGDELRSVTVMPAVGYETIDMFRMHNGTGLRNMTLQGLSGTLGTPNENLTRRPTAGAFVSLDPANGPTDTYAHITNKSPYVQNVTTFGTGCIGMKVDGDLHSSGNKSMVANDFTQILSDGIGYWVNGQGRSELVSVFTYYCHIGYLATAGGKVRALNGNNSYGLYGSVAEGFNGTETPGTALVNNQSKEAQIFNVYSDQNQIYGFGYTNAGKNYTNATVTLASAGVGAAPVYNEFRKGGISEIKVTEEDSNFIGGANYQYLVNKAQSGNTTQITLSGADNGTPAKYIGMRVRITAGRGAGQYAQIATFRSDIKLATVITEANGQPGWEHVTGQPITAAFDDSTYYAIEPRVDIPEPTYAASSVSLPSASRWSSVAHNGNDKWVAVAKGGNAAASSSDGLSWGASTLPSNADWSKVTWANNRFIAVAEAGQQSAYSTDGTSWTGTSLTASKDWSDVSGRAGSNVVIAVARTGDSTGSATIDRSTNNGETWSGISTGVTADWAGVAYGSGKWVIIEGGGARALYSTDDGVTWTQTALPSSQEWNSVIFGQDRFVAISEKTDSSACPTAVSFDGITWYAGSVETGQWRDIAYNQGLYVALDPLSDIVATSQDGFVWKSKVTPDAQDWTGIAAYDGVWVGVANATTTGVRIVTGATAKAIAIVGSNRIGTFILSDPGSYYQSGTPPVVTVFDPVSTLALTSLCDVNDGVLPQPTFTNRGTGYFSVTAEITAGDGFADIAQDKDRLIVSNLTKLPGPGDNIAIGGIDGVTYYVVKTIATSGAAPAFNAEFQISPALGRAEAPAHGTTITLRELYSQIRLTGHDFLDIGSGNFGDTAYPSLYIFGFNAVNEPQQYYEVLQFNGGRVFYTSTDQDGNFRVGELFEVEQSTGTISINASFFDLNGLEELSLGGVVLGGTGAVVREFSTDGTFTANSNNIVPTQKAIGIYVKSRISSGGSDIAVNRLNAGDISFSGDKIFHPLDGVIVMNNVVKFGAGAAGIGSMLTSTMFASGGNINNG